MAPTAASHHSPKPSPSQETMAFPKRSLRNRGSNATLTTTTDGVGGESEKDGGGVKTEFDGGHDARGKSPPSKSHQTLFDFFPDLLSPRKIKGSVPVIYRQKVFWMNARANL